MHSARNPLLEREVNIQDAVSAYYDSLRYSNEYSFKYHKWLIDKMVSLVRCSGRILDNGCGVGILSNLYPNLKVVGLDVSFGMLKKAKSKNKDIVCANSESLPFNNLTFDTVFCRSILHHLVQPDNAAREIYRVLKPKGELVLMETNRSSLNSLPRRLAKKTEHFSELHKNFAKKEVLDILRRYFTIDDIHHFGFIAYPLIGFPDLLNIFGYLPWKAVLAKSLMQLDERIAGIPFLKEQSWGIIIKCVKR